MRGTLGGDVMKVMQYASRRNIVCVSESVSSHFSSIYCNAALSMNLPEEICKASSGI